MNDFFVGRPFESSYVGVALFRNGFVDLRFREPFRSTRSDSFRPEDMKEFFKGLFDSRIRRHAVQERYPACGLLSFIKGRTALLGDIFARMFLAPPEHRHPISQKPTLAAARTSEKGATATDYSLREHLAPASFAVKFTCTSPSP
jgi:hypothetical protein